MAVFMPQATLETLSCSSANIFLSPSVGQAFLTLSPLQISSLAVISGRLWVGTGGGAIFSIPLSISEFYLDGVGT